MQEYDSFQATPLMQRWFQSLKCNKRTKKRQVGPKV